MILGRSGIVSTIPIKLDDVERDLINKSAKNIRGVISEAEAKLVEGLKAVIADAGGTSQLDTVQL